MFRSMLLLSSSHVQFRPRMALSTRLGPRTILRAKQTHLKTREVQDDGDDVTLILHCRTSPDGRQYFEQFAWTSSFILRRLGWSKKHFATENRPSEAWTRWSHPRNCLDFDHGFLKRNDSSRSVARTLSRSSQCDGWISKKNVNFQTSHAYLSNEFSRSPCHLCCARARWCFFFWFFCCKKPLIRSSKQRPGRRHDML